LPTSPLDSLPPSRQPPRPALDALLHLAIPALHQPSICNQFVSLTAHTIIHLHLSHLISHLHKHHNNPAINLCLIKPKSAISPSPRLCPKPPYRNLHKHNTTNPFCTSSHFQTLSVPSNHSIHSSPKPVPKLPSPTRASSSAFFLNHKSDHHLISNQFNPSSSIHKP
jgi:hypothetical protein